MNIRTTIKTVRVIGLAFVAVFALGCSNFLEKNPQGVETSEGFFQTTDQAIRAINGVYDAAGWELSSEVAEWVLGDICSDDAIKGGWGDGDHPEWLQLKYFQANSASNPTLGYQYRDSYIGIVRANRVIANVPGMDIDSALRVRIVGEAKFLRAHFYFNLVKVFGGVPLVTRVLASTEYNQPKATVAACWAQIEKDFKEAAAALPFVDEYGAEDIGRATKGAAQAMLARAYLYQGDFANAEIWADFVINSHKYKLETNYSDFFKNAHKNGEEAIFDIQHTVDPGDGWADDNEGQETTVFVGGATDPFFMGWGFNCPTQDLVDAFETRDPRLKATVISNGDTLYPAGAVDADGDGEMDTVAFVADNSDVDVPYHTRKYALEYEGPYPSNESNAPANWHVIRYADVLLIYAEAANEMGRGPQAADKLNEVRARARASLVDTAGQDTVLIDIPFTSKVQLRTAIWDERRVELAMEGQRFFDIVRQGRGEALLGANGFREGINNVFPIPATEIALSSKLKQNTGY